MERTLKILDRVISACLVSFAVFSMFSISLTQISCGIGGIAWLIKVHLTRSWKDLKLPLGIPILLFVLACVLAVATAVDPGNSYKSLKKLLQWIIFFWAINSIRDDGQRDRLALLLVAAGCIASLNGFYQAWAQGVSLNSRVEGTMSVYMTFAGLLMLVGLFCLGRFLFRQPREKWLLAAFSVITVCLLLTLTRQAWLGFLAGLIFLLFTWRKIFVLTVPVLVALVLIFPPQPVKERLHSMINLEDASLQIRMNLWRGGWAIFKDHPLTGCGFKCVDVVHSKYPDPEGHIAKFKGLHNNFIQLAVDTGIIGLGTWLSIWVCYFLALYRNLVSLPTESPARWVSFASASAVIGFLAGGIFEVNFYDSEVAMLLYFIMALPFVSSRPGTSS